MNKRIILTSLLALLILPQLSFSQGETTDVTMFIFGHSLLNHELQINETPSQETSVPHWLHFLSEAGDRKFKISGQYGFLPQHANLPPIAQWGFDFAEPAWESDYETFAEAEFSHILLTPGNFIQWQAPDVNYPYEDVSPLSATNDILNWCDDQTDKLNFYIYENWPDMAPYLSSGFPPSTTEWENYNQFLQTDFADWFDEYHQLLAEAHSDKCVKLIPVGRLISELLQMSPYDEININALYEDDAPHGRPSKYFLASMITYMAIYESPTPMSYQVTEFIDPIIAENYQAINNFFWNRLNEFMDASGESTVFCKANTHVNDQPNSLSQYLPAPNPVKDQFQLNNLKHDVDLSLYDNTGRILKTKKAFNASSIFSMQEFPEGNYFLKLSDHHANKIEYIKIIKI